MKHAIDLYNQHVALAGVDLEKIRKALYAEGKQLRDFIYQDWKLSEKMFLDLLDAGRIEKNDAKALMKQYVEAVNGMAQAAHKYQQDIDKLVETIGKYKHTYQ